MVTLGRENPLNINRYTIITPFAQRRSRLSDETFPVYNWVHYAVQGWINDGRERLDNRDINAELNVLIQNNFQPPH